MTQYEPVYEPRFLLELTEPVGTEVVKIADLDIPRRFVYTVFIVSDEGKMTEYADRQIPQFVIRLAIEVTQEGKPFIADFGLSNFLKPITGWQFGFISKYRVELLTRAVRRVAECWRYTKKGRGHEWKQVAGMVIREKKGNQSIERMVEGSKFLPKPQRFKLDREIKIELAKRKLDDSFYRNFASQYLEAQQAGLNPIQELSLEYLGTPDRTIQRWATTCRELGFLPRIKPGRPSTNRKNQSQRKGKNGNTKKAKSR